MARVAVFSHESCLSHQGPPGHPERPERLTAVLYALDAQPFEGVQKLTATQADDGVLTRFHTPAYLAALASASPAAGLVSLDADTFMAPASLTAARHAAGAARDAVDMVLAGDLDRAFCAVRPPGHHAEQAQAYGFCLFHNAAIAALHALDAHGLSRVAIVDFDVHHGNGSQAASIADPRIMTFSIQQWPLWPGSGSATETSPHGNLVNRTAPKGADGSIWRPIFLEGLAAVEAFEPELIIVSAGFDAHVDDPLAGLALTAEDFGWATTQIVAVAERVCGGKLVSTLEGGYHLQALAACASAHVLALMDG
jgi:acetoin utilization deacetylase AcuC-like enzyme